jgi:phospholipase C
MSDIKHVVILMQENRSFDHDFGTSPGVAGFSDPTAITLPGVAGFSDPAANTLVSLSPATGQVTRKVRVGAKPFAVALSPDGWSACVADMNADAVSVVRASSPRAGPRPW